MQRDTFSKGEMAVYDAIVASGEAGITLGALVKRFGQATAATTLESLQRGFTVHREGCRFFAAE